MSVSVWKTEITDFASNKIIEYINKLNNNSSMLLDLNKIKKNYLEKFVYETTIFHSNTRYLNDLYIEFCCRDEFFTQMNYDEKVKTPLSSYVCFFTESNLPTMVTNTDFDIYLYKDFESQSEIFMSFPEKNKQLVINGKFWHGSIEVSECDTFEKNRHIIVINVWDSLPNNIEKYSGDDDDNDEETEIIISMKEDKTIKNVKCTNDFLNRQLFENIFYKRDKKSVYRFKDFIDKNAGSYKFFKEVANETTKKLDEPQAVQNELQTQNILDDIKDFSENKIKHNRFTQRFTFIKIYTADLCNYIIKETEKYGLECTGYQSVDKISTIFARLLESLKTIIDKIQKSYGIDSNEILFNVKDLIIIKSLSDSHCEQKENSLLSFCILLSECAEILFDDGTTYFMNQGDLLIYSSHSRYKIKPLKKGDIFNLVGYFDLQINKKKNLQCYCALHFK